MGTRRLYSVNVDGLADLRAYLDVFWGDALARFKTVAESEENRP
jgi:hypothetical protein